MQALKGFRATDVSLMALMFFHAICAIITGSMLPRIIAEFNLDYSTAGGGIVKVEFGNDAREHRPRDNGAYGMEEHERHEGYVCGAESFESLHGVSLSDPA